MKKITPSKDLSVAMMIRNENPTAFFALLSVLPGVEKAIVVDTGSTDGTIELVEEIQKEFPDKIEFHQIKLPDSTGWSFQKHIAPNVPLGNLRAWIAEQIKTKYIWIVDGDEVYRQSTVEKIVDFCEHWPEGKNVIHIPLLWFARDIHHLAVTDPPSYPCTGRLFKREGFKISGAFPGEMAVYDGEVILPTSKSALIIQEWEPFHHYELTQKPHRRRLLEAIPYRGPQPEVFKKYGLSEK